LSQGSHAGEVVGCHREHEHLIDFLQSPYHHLAHVAKGLGPAKALLDELSLLLRDAVALRVSDRPIGAISGSGYWSQSMIA